MARDLALKMHDSQLTEIHDALDDALRRAYCEVIHHDLFDGSIHMRCLSLLQQAAWDAVRSRVEATPINQWAGSGRSPYVR